MADVMANPDTALDTFLGSVSQGSDEGGGGQADAPKAPDPATEGGAEKESGESKTGTEKPDSTTADDAAQAKAAAKEKAELAEEYKPFKTLLEGKKLDPNSKEFGPTILKSYSELERAHTQANTDKSMLNNRSADLQRRISGDIKSINEYRKLNGLPEIPMGKTFAEQVKERAEMFTHVNNVLTGQDPEAAKQSHAWLSKQLVEELQNLRVKAAVEETQQSKTGDDHQKDFYGKAASHYTEHIARNKDDEAVFNQFVLPLAAPNGLLGSFGLSPAHVAQSPEHLAAFAKIGKALQLAENYDKAVADGIKAGVDEAMASKRKAGNAGSVGSQGKQSGGAAGGNDEFYRDLARR